MSAAEPNVARYVHALLERRIFPGITILVGRRGQVVDHRRYGFLAVYPREVPFGGPAIYDLASLTKPLVTAFLVQMLIERGEIAADAPFSRYFPTFARDCTIEQLLTHTAGIPAWYPLYLYNPDYVEQIRALPPAARPGKRVIYSCLGYILLHALVERITGQDFAVTAQREIFAPLGLSSTFFRVPHERLSDTAPTELGNEFERNLSRGEHEPAAALFPWRTHLLHGETNDGNSFHHGGTAGNAGLFSSAADIFTLTREFFPETATLLQSSSIEAFWRNYTPRLRTHRSYGFKLNSSFSSAGGRALSPQAIGHSGFTGTSLYLERSSGHVYILLTNRIHPHVTRCAFDRIRRRLHKLLKAEWGLS